MRGKRIGLCTDIARNTGFPPKSHPKLLKQQILSRHSRTAHPISRQSKYALDIFPFPSNSQKRIYSKIEKLHKVFIVEQKKKDFFVLFHFHFNQISIIKH